MKVTPIVPGEISLLAIGYKYNSRRVLGFIATEGAGINETGDPYLSCFPEIYYNVSICPIVHDKFPGRYFKACNAIEKCNMMRKYDLEI